MGDGGRLYGPLQSPQYDSGRAAQQQAAAQCMLHMQMWSVLSVEQHQRSDLQSGAVDVQQEHGNFVAVGKTRADQITVCTGPGRV